MTIELTMNNIENTLSFYALYPVFGLIPGTEKVAIGIIQTVTGLAIGIFAILPILFNKPINKQLFLRAFRHIPHGIGNIIAGAIEAVPIVGTIFVAIRYIRVVNSDKGPDALCTETMMMEHPSFKFYSYKHNTIEAFLRMQRIHADSYN